MSKWLIKHSSELVWIIAIVVCVFRMASCVEAVS